MILKRHAAPSDSFSVHADQLESLKKACRAFGLLNAWQLRKYRLAVAENKWYMGERFGRRVAWAEAEEDFLHNDFYGCAPKWRVEYCGSHCPFLDSCALGQQFCSKDNTAL